MKQFRTVKRRAKVGERILITNKYDWEHRYKNGSVGEVLGLGVESVFVQFEGVNAGVDHYEYEVIIEEVNPKEENEMESKQLTEYSYEELLDAIKAKAQEEASNVSLDGKEIANAITSFGGQAKSMGVVTAESIRKMLAKSTGVTSAELLARVNSHRTPQQQRDEIIEQAKRDVVELESIMDSSFRPPIKGNNTFMEMRTFVKFFVNKEKRAVTALVYCGEYGYLVEKGIAKCAPTDCFNVHIGKAIALRRALGLDVPSEYLTAPQPTEVRVGDVVRGKYAGEGEGTYDLTIKSIGTSKYSYVEGGFDYINDAELRIIDDSREGE